MIERIGDAPIDPALRDEMNRLAHLLDKYFNGNAKGKDKQIGFVLMVFPFEGYDGRCNYISNAGRTDVVTLMKGQIKRFEGQPEMEGHA